MTPRAIRPISQVNSRHSTRSRTSPASHYSFKSNVAQQCYRLRSSTRATTLRATLRQQVAACLNKKNRSPRDCHCLRCFTRASSAARLHPRPKSERPVGAQPHRLRSLTRAISYGQESRRRRVKLIHGSAIKTDDPTRIIVLSDRRESKGRSRLPLIYGSAIKTSGKRPRINKLQNSNRR